MARNHRTTPPPQSPILTLDQLRRRRERIEQCVRDLEAFNPQTVQKRFNSPEVVALQTSIEEALAAAFGDATPAYRRYESAARLDQGAVTMAGFNVSAAAHEAQNRAKAHQYLAEGKLRSIALLQQAIRALDELIADQPDVGPEPAAISAQEVDLTKVFIVHGHDGEVRETVARFIERLGLEPVILHERPNKGRTIITKFREESADVGFAVVLMTPDDLGGPAPVATTAELNARARQNVVFELGFFIGALGPERVAAIIRGNMERPSDFDGVVYISFDKEDWGARLGQELQAAGYEIDWNRVMRR